MKIQTIKSQYRRDFIAIYECEHCGVTLTSHGFDDKYFHDIVIPNMRCSSCGCIAGENYIPKTPKYAAHEII